MCQTGKNLLTRTGRAQPDAASPTRPRHSRRKPVGDGTQAHSHEPGRPPHRAASLPVPSPLAEKKAHYFKTLTY